MTLLRFPLLFSLALAILLSALPTRAAAQDGAAAQRFLEGRHERADRILGRAPSDARTSELQTLLRELLDLDALAEAALGDHWDEHSEQERAEFVALLRQLVERSYTTNLEQTLDFRVEYTGTRAVDGDVLVSTNARSRANRRAPAISIDYLMRRNGRSWRVVDITTDGQSLVQGYRAQFHRIITRDGWSGLVERMQRRLNRG